MPDNDQAQQLHDHDHYDGADDYEHAATQNARYRPHSIDESLELEHQLMNELHSPTSPTAGRASRPVSLDPHVLTSIIANLRQSLVDITKERDGLIDSVATAHSREAELKEALALVSEKCTSLEAEMTELRAKSQTDEEAIAMLRTKVEESRRGLMRLQTESRRMSQMSNMSLDTSKAGASSFTLGATPPSAKRASFAPLTGSTNKRIAAHRRVSSVSDSAYILGDQNGDSHQPSTSPNAQTLTFPDDLRTSSHSTSNASRRISGLFGLGSPPLSQQNASDASSVLAAQVEALRRELGAARSELEEARHEAVESMEAREASELCVTALRSYISENAVGENRGDGHAKLPPLPPGIKSEDSDSKKASGWSALKLWRVDTNTSRTSVPESSVVSPQSTFAPASEMTPQTATVTTPATAKPLSKKIGDFFSSRASTSSVSSQPTPHSHQQEAMFNGSDVSSVDESEPVSPDSGNAHGSIIVRDVTNGPSSSDMRGSLEAPHTKDLDDLQSHNETTRIGV